MVTHEWQMCAMLFVLQRCQLSSWHVRVRTLQLGCGAMRRRREQEEQHAEDVEAGASLQGELPVSAASAAAHFLA